MCALYSFLRVTDDLIDALEMPAVKRASLSAWRREFDGALAGHYQHPLHAAFHDTMKAYAIPREYIDAVLDGVEMDLEQTSYATFAELYEYCYRVASAVGLACIHIWGFADPSAKKYAESAGVALQITNILRDLREDSERGRVYLPREDLERFGYREEQLRQGIRDEHFRALMTFQVSRAREYYAAARPLSALLPPAGRAVFQVMTRTYEGLLNEIVERDYDVFTSRVSLSRWRKLSLVVQAMPARWGWT